MKHGQNRFELYTTSYIMNRYSSDKRMKMLEIARESRKFKEHCKKHLLSVGILEK